MNDKPVIGIIGFGFVGKATQHAFEEVAEFKIHDINPNLSKDEFLPTIFDSQYIYVCVPTPMNEETGESDVSIVDDVLWRAYSIAKGTTKIIIIKSTIPPETTKKFIEKYPDMNIIHIPEFLTERLFLLDAINPSRIIFGIPSELIKKGKVDNKPFVKLFRFYKKRFPGTTMFVCDSTTAELAKYTCNAFFSVKVSFFNEIKQIANKLNVNYDQFIGMVLADGRIGNSHWKVPGHDGNYGFGGHCFPKDLNAIIYKAKQLKVKPHVMNAAWKKNLEVRKKRDWEQK